MWWTAKKRWDLTFSRALILISGLAIFGLGEALLLQSNIGNSPWTVLAQGLTLHTPFNIGTATFLISGTVLALWIPLRERPGFGTIANMFVIAIFLEIGVNLIPKVESNFILSLVMVLSLIHI